MACAGADFRDGSFQSSCLAVAVAGDDDGQVLYKAAAGRAARQASQAVVHSISLPSNPAAALPQVRNAHSGLPPTSSEGGFGDAGETPAAPPFPLGRLRLLLRELRRKMDRISGSIVYLIA